MHGSALFLDRGDRRTTLTLLAGGFAAVIVFCAFAIATENQLLLAFAGAAALVPALLYTAVRWPYVFPYGLYLLLLQFDDVLRLPMGASLTRFVVLGSAATLAIYLARKRSIERPPAALFFWLAFLLYAFAELYRSTDLTQGFGVVQAFLAIILLGSAVALAPIDLRQLRFLCALTIFAGVAASLYGLLLFHQHPELVAKEEGRMTIELFGKAIDQNAYADSLLMPFALALVATFAGRTVRGVGMPLVAAAICLWAIVASLSREALLAAGLAALVVILFSRRRVLALALGVPPFVLLPLFVPAIGERMSSALSTGGAGRTSIWHVDWVAFLQQPIFGWGAGNSIEAYNRNYLAVYQAYNAGWSRPPHNTLLFLGVEFGLVGIALFVGGWLAAFGAMRGIGRSHPLWDLRVAVTAGLVALTLAGMFIDISTLKFTWAALFLALQLGTVKRRLQPNS